MLLLKGIGIGGANVMPGVSGATFAVIFRVYDKLIESINNLFTDFKGSLKFIIPFGLGMAMGIVLLGSLIDFFITRFSLQTSSFIAGLMAGSIPFFYKKALSQIASSEKKYSYYVITILATLIIVLLSTFTQATGVYLDAGLNIGLILLLFLGGALAAGAMMIPGVSGAMVLILLGLYPMAMHTITLIREYLLTPFNFELLGPILIFVVPVGVGVVVGILLTSRIIAGLLAKHYSRTYFAIIGLIFGTVFVLFNEETTYQSYDIITTPIIIFTIVSFVLGIVASLLLGKK